MKAIIDINPQCAIATPLVDQDAGTSEGSRKCFVSIPLCELRNEATGAEKPRIISRLTEFDHGIPVLAHKPCTVSGGPDKFKTILLTKRKGKAPNDNEPFDSHA